MKMDTVAIPEKAKLLQRLKDCGFNVPDFIYVPASDFKTENFNALASFLEHHHESFKVIARSAHPQESHFKGGTFDSLETYADLGGIKYARKRMARYATSTKDLSIRRQQVFNAAPHIDIEEMGVIVMPFVFGSSVMAKKLWDHWEFGYCRDRIHKVKSEPYITRTPHDRELLTLSQEIQNCLGFACEIEYVISAEGKIHVVQAKDITEIDVLELKESERSMELEGVQRIRTRRNYRERPLYVMDTHSFYMNIIHKCEEVVNAQTAKSGDFDKIFDYIDQYQAQMDRFALHHQRFAILGLCIQPPEDLHQIATHYLDDTPELQKRLSKALHNNLYQADKFIIEADTLISKNKYRINLCGHDAYGIDTVRNPIWEVYWSSKNHDSVAKSMQAIGFKTGDTVGIDIDGKGIPTVYRL